MAKTLFDHLNAIYNNQRIDYWETLDESDKKTFNSYMINRFISMNHDYLPIVNEIQQYWEHVKNRELYLFYSQILPKKKQFNKYIKSSKENVDYEDWIIQLLCKHHSISTDEAIEYLRIYYSTPEGRHELTEFLLGYGCDTKKIKKAGLYI